MFCLRKNRKRGNKFGSLASNPSSRDGVLAADHLQEGGPSGGRGLHGASKGRDDLVRRLHPLTVDAHAFRDLRGAEDGGRGDGRSAGMAAGPPKAGAIATEAAIVDVHGNDGDFLAEADLEVADEVAEPRIPTEVDHGPLRIRQLGAEGSP
jgi:hypothetical protein